MMIELCGFRQLLITVFVSVVRLAIAISFDLNTRLLCFLLLGQVFDCLLGHSVLGDQCHVADIKRNQRIGTAQKYREVVVCIASRLH